MICLPDINIWLALTFSAHPHHPAALSWFDDQESSSVAFCRMTQQGFLRLASNPKVFRTDALTLSESWIAFDTLMSDDRLAFFDEPSQLDETWRKFTGDESFSPKIWDDAYLAAFAIMAGMKMVTFDTGFKRYEGLVLGLLGSGK